MNKLEESLEERLNRVLALKKMTKKALAEKIGVSEQGLGKMFKNESLKVKVQDKILVALNATPAEWYGIKDETSGSLIAAGTGNIAGDKNKQKVQIGTKSAVKSTGMTFDELYTKLLNCEKDREKDQEVFKAKLAGLNGLLAAKDETIKLLSQKR